MIPISIRIAQGKDLCRWRETDPWTKDSYMLTKWLCYIIKRLKGEGWTDSRIATELGTTPEEVNSLLIWDGYRKEWPPPPATTKAATSLGLDSVRSEDGGFFILFDMVC
jgi:hypothetical protein